MPKIIGCTCGHHKKAHVFARGANGFCLACIDCEGFTEETFEPEPEVPVELVELIEHKQEFIGFSVTHLQSTGETDPYGRNIVEEVPDERH